MNDQHQWGRAKYYLFRDLFEWWGPAVVTMEGRDKTLPPWRDTCPAMIALRRRANAEWEAITGGLPPLGNPGEWYAAGVAATEYPLPKVQQMTVDELRAIVTNWAQGVKARRGTPPDDMLADVLKFLGAKPALCNLLELLWQHKNEVVPYDSMQDHWPDPKLESTIKRNLHRLQTGVSRFDPTGHKVFLDYSHAGRWAKVRVSEK